MGVIAHRNSASCKNPTLLIDNNNHHQIATTNTENTTNTDTARDIAADTERLVTTSLLIDTVKSKKRDSRASFSFSCASDTSSQASMSSLSTSCSSSKEQSVESYSKKKSTNTAANENNNNNIIPFFTCSTPSMRRSSQQWMACLTFMAVMTLFWLRHEDMEHVSLLEEDRSMFRGGRLVLGNNTLARLNTTRAKNSLNATQAKNILNATRAKNSLNAIQEKKSSSKRVTAAPVNPIRQISILGERNSGTRWTYDHISECFNHSLIVTKHLTRYKHWFQYEDASKYEHDTLVLAQFRNPYDWFKAMEHVPHHSPAHLRTRHDASLDSISADNDWRIFLSKPWTMPRVGKDLELFGNETCQEDFKYRDLISCVLEPLPSSYYNHTIRYSEHQPFYEMRNDGSGEPYENILELRSDKIRNFLSVAKYPGVADVWVVQYEYLVNKGTEQLLKRIAEWTNVKPKCPAKPPQNRVQKKSRQISKEFAVHIRKNLNWTVEEWIGYQVEKAREQSPLDW